MLSRTEDLKEHYTGATDPEHRQCGMWSDLS